MIHGFTHTPYCAICAHDGMTYKVDGELEGIKIKLRCRRCKWVQFMYPFNSNDGENEPKIRVPNRSDVLEEHFR